MLPINLKKMTYSYCDVMYSCVFRDI